MSRGSQSTPIAAGKTTDTVVRASPGSLVSIIVTATGTNPLLVWDNASGHTGTIIGALGASPPIGRYEFESPANNGITVQGNAANPAVTIVWD